MNDKEVKIMWDKFEKFAGDRGYAVRLPYDLGFMDSRDGNVMILKGEKEAVIVKRNEVTDAEYKEVKSA